MLTPLALPVQTVGSNIHMRIKNPQAGTWGKEHSSSEEPEHLFTGGYEETQYLLVSLHMKIVQYWCDRKIK